MTLCFLDVIISRALGIGIVSFIIFDRGATNA